MTSAHLSGGEHKTQDNFIVDFGHEPETLTASQESFLSINLQDAATREVIVPESVWIRITKQNTIIFAGTFQPEAEHVAFSFTFPESGDYELTTRFKDSKETITEAKFPIHVEGNQFKAVSLASLVVVLLAVLFISQKKKKI